jgi:4-hydroxybenzoate polyprenyltransferase
MLQGLAEPQSSPVGANACRALVIDLEGALLRSDLLHEAFFSDVRQSFASLRARRPSNRAALMEALADANIDYDRLPYDPEALNLVLAGRAQGRKIYLAFTRFRAHAEAIASHLGFDGVVASSDVTADGHKGALPFELDSFQRVGGRVGRREINWRIWLNALRVYQYAKNSLVFVPALTSHQMSPAAWGSALLAFLAFSACASGAYLLNDLIDLAADRRHPGKVHRAIASGDLPISRALIAIPVLWLGSIAAALAISTPFLAALGAYLATTIAYSLLLKKKMLVDIVTLAGLYTIRIVGGSVAVGVTLSEWLLMFSFFIFTSLALIKRYGELMMCRGEGLSDPTNRDYKVGDAEIIGALAASSGMNAVIVFSLYASSTTVMQMYSRPWMLWLVNPLLLYWISRALLAAHRRMMSDDPIIYTFTDSGSRIAIAAIMCIVLAAI